MQLLLFVLFPLLMVFVGIHHTLASPCRGGGVYNYGPQYTRLVCPPLVPGIEQSCDAKCSSEHCPGVCCSNGCGTVCYDGVNNPQCPLLVPGQAGVCLIDERCYDNSTQCTQDSGVCCKTNCGGLVCVTPVTSSSTSDSSTAEEPTTDAPNMCPDPDDYDICIEDTRCMNGDEKCLAAGGVCCNTKCKSQYCKLPGQVGPTTMPAPTCPPPPKFGPCIVPAVCANGGIQCKAMGGICCSNGCGQDCIMNTTPKLNP